MPRSRIPLLLGSHKSRFPVTFCNHHCLYFTSLFSHLFSIICFTSLYFLKSPKSSSLSRRGFSQIEGANSECINVSSFLLPCARHGFIQTCIRVTKETKDETVMDPSHNGYIHVHFLSAERKLIAVVIAWPLGTPH
jgi:hypothetical protein